MTCRRKICMALLIICVLAMVIGFIYYDSFLNIDLAYMDPMIFFKNIFLVFFLFWFSIIVILLIVIKK